MASQKLLVVFGATGNQGHSVVATVLSDSRLSSEYAVRAVSRDVSHPAMQALKALGAEVVQADMSDASTLPAALAGAHTIFLMTATDYVGDTRATETHQAKNVCSAAVDAGASYIIWSGLDSVTKGSNGKLTNVVSFDVKEEIEQHIRSLPLKSSFFIPGDFMQNFLDRKGFSPELVSDDQYVLKMPFPPDHELPLIDITETGRFVAPILLDPDKYEGKRLCAGTRMYTMAEIAKSMGKVAGKVVKYEQISYEGWGDSLPTQIPPHTREWIVEMFRWTGEYGVNGPDTAEKVKWAAEQAWGPLIEFEDLLRKSGFKLPAELNW